MFQLFKKSSPAEKLEKEYRRLLEESYRLSTIDRMKSDLKAAEAQEILKEIENLKKEG